jgi:hypothetical protein
MQPTYRLAVGHSLAALVASCLILSGGCDKSSRSSTAPTGPSPSVPSPPEPSGQVIRLGEPISGTITSSDSSCTFTTSEGSWGGLCHTFRITAPARGTLVATAHWTVDAPLAMFFKTAAGQQMDISCCGRPAVGRVPVEADSVLVIELAYVGRPPGYPIVPPVPYTLETVLMTGDLQQRGTLNARVFADDMRTQQLSQAHIEVLEGPSAGRIARFNEITGLYEIPDLPPGFVRVRTSARGFNPVEEQLVVGAQLPREMVLQRIEPLPDATHALGGHASREGSPNSYLIRVKIEILDGPLSGVFTFTDDDMGLYTIRSLPPGVIQIRASLGGLSQTVSVEISASSTQLNFSLSSM